MQMDTAPKRKRQSGKNLGIDVKLRATDEDQKYRWQMAATRDGMALNEWIRWLLDERESETRLNEARAVKRKMKK